MALFGRRRGADEPSTPAAIRGLADVMAAKAFAPVAGQLFDGHIEQTVHDATPTMYGIGHDTQSRKVTRIGATVFGDAFRGTVDGRAVTVANAWTNIGPELRSAKGDMCGVAVCAVELSTILPISCVQSRGFSPITHLRSVATGDAAFDQRFLVFPVSSLEQHQLSTDLLQQIMAHDDWVFCAERYLLGCISKGAFTSADEFSRRIDEVVHIAGAFSGSMPASRVEHPEDDLIARISRLTSIEEALAFLEQVTPDERVRLARSDTPLAAFADVRTPQEAQERFSSLDEGGRLQILAMFMKVKDQEGGG